MPSTTWNVNKDAVTADNGVSLGAGAMDYLPVGNYAGYDYRAFLQFAYSFTGIVSITSAILHMKTTGQVKVAFGSDPDLEIRRVNATWGEGTASALSSTNAIERSNEPGVLGSTVTWDVTTSENAWDTVDITTIIQEAFSAGVFYGIRLVAATTSGTDVTEFYAREYGSNDAYITVTYTTNRLPDAPTLVSPAILATKQSLTPSLVFEHNDPDGDPPVTYDIQVSTDGTFASVTHWNLVNGSSGMVGDTITRVYAGTALSNNTTYWWRARTNDGTGDGPWSVSQSFKTAQLPVATLTEPSATGRLGKLSYTAGAGWGSPRLNVGWSFTCPDGGTQQSYQVQVASDSAGSPGAIFSDTGTVSSSGARTAVIAATLTEAAYYHVRVRVTCSHGQTSTYTGYFRIRTRWGVVTHRHDLGAAPVSWSITTLNTTEPTNSDVVVEYGSNTVTTTPGTFYASLSSAGLARYFFYKAWLLAWGASPATSPSLDKMTLSYSVNALTADKWSSASPANVFIDPANYVYGTQSLRLSGTGGVHTAYQLVPVVPDTDYILSGRIRSVGNSQAKLSIATLGTGGNLVTQTAAGGSGPTFSQDEDWTRVNTPVWNSGANTEIYIACRVDGAVGTYAWFDAIKMEATTVVSPWTPGFLAEGVVVDAGGVQIDASNGGIFRLRGSTGGSTDTFTLGSRGVVFGGDVELYRGGPGEVYLASTATDAMFRIVGPSSNEYAAFLAMITGDSSARAVFGRSGDVDRTGMFLGPGSSARDVSIYRQGTAALAVEGHLAMTSGRLRFGNIITPTALAANTNDWNPTGLATAQVIRMQTDAALRQLTGIVAGTDGDLLLLLNVNATQATTLVHAATSVAANQFFCPNNVNFTLNARAGVWLWYDGSSAKWRVLD